MPDSAQSSDIYDVPADVVVYRENYHNDAYHDDDSRKCSHKACEDIDDDGVAAPAQHYRVSVRVDLVISAQLRCKTLHRLLYVCALRSIDENNTHIRTACVLRAFTELTEGILVEQS